MHNFPLVGKTSFVKNIFQGKNSGAGNYPILNVGEDETRLGTFEIEEARNEYFVKELPITKTYKGYDTGDQKIIKDYNFEMQHLVFQINNYDTYYVKH